MTAYELMIKTNYHLIKGGELTTPQKANITRQLLAAQSLPDVVRWGDMYPKFFIPPDRDSKKFQTVVPMSPATQILSQNSYELEIIRLLHMFAPEDSKAAVSHIVDETLSRLKKTCFGYKRCAKGECFESAIVTLRFLSTVAPTRTDWMKKQISVFNSHYFDKRRRSGVLMYFWLCLLELPIAIAEPEIHLYKNIMLSQPVRKQKKGEDPDLHLVFANIVRNTLMRLPEFSLILGQNKPLTMWDINKLEVTNERI
ncbi:MAG: hypothetical protein FWC92_08040 [Defluviitaleaceae bacterium]|nr:hypothetical protein [Defluviitaleaceae bacterium]